MGSIVANFVEGTTKAPKWISAFFEVTSKLFGAGSCRLAP